MAWLIFANLVFFFIQFRLVSTRATLPLCTCAHMQALITPVGGEHLTIVCMFEGTTMGLLQKCLLIFLFLNDAKICTY